jgi:hypothetical protein
MKTYAFDCGRGQIVYTRQISVGLTAPVYNTPLVEVMQAACGAAQLNHVRQVRRHFLVQLPM